MPSRIVEAEYLHYYNPARNSDKVFNIFLVEEDDGRYSCISEYGRRGTSLVRVVVCSNKSRPVAERAFRKKLDAKRNHRETPYWDSRAGSGQSPYAQELVARSVPASKISTPVTADPIQEQKRAEGRAVSGILNQGQIDSLEI
ncbi:MAG TPA: WGR domain-containing protein [Pyrinomonadaceae bacterium]|nr:WGR domain-containing protein [Pyrinomonadaceae bacterium]